MVQGPPPVILVAEVDRPPPVQYRYVPRLMLIAQDIARPLMPKDVLYVPVQVSFF